MQQHHTHGHSHGHGHTQHRNNKHAKVDQGGPANQGNKGRGAPNNAYFNANTANRSPHAPAHANMTMAPNVAQQPQNIAQTQQQQFQHQQFQAQQKLQMQQMKMQQQTQKAQVAKQGATVAVAHSNLKPQNMAVGNK